MGPIVHLTLTREWAIEAGLEEIAEDVAMANVDYDALYPGGRSLANASRHLGFSAWVRARLYLRRAIDECSPRYLGWALHSAQDFHSHGYLGEKHLLHTLHLTKRHPDDWDEAPTSVKRRVETVSRHLLARYRAAVDAGLCA